MKRKASSVLSNICLGAAFLGGVGGTVCIGMLDNTNTNEINTYWTISSAFLAYASFGIGILGLYLRQEHYK
ncbi:hypothetical protein J4477_02510 [Candidatus Pacearchaeota archaeon]|nr:hypothetical protein [Candidatus Pacearchaeota archaeon]